MKDKEIKQHIANGYILCKVIFEMAGGPKEHVERTIKKYVNAVKEDPSYLFMNEYYSECEQQEGTEIWSMFYESDVLVANLEKLNILCFNLSPASIEIIEPEEFRFTQKNLTDWYNDLISKLHEISAGFKNMSSENDLLKLNINKLIRNCILLSLGEPKTAEEISIKTGIDSEHLQHFLEAMIKEKSIAKDADRYVSMKKQS